MIHKHQATRQLKGIKLSNTCPELSHSFFADNTLFFINTSCMNCSTLARILETYCIISGQSANLDKSSIFFLANTPPEVKCMVGEILGIGAAADPGKYLGIPSIWGKTKHPSTSVHTGKSPGQGSRMEQIHTILCRTREDD